ncbi:Stage V sporulation protein D [compost metagenome]
MPGEAAGRVTPEQQADFAALAYGHGQLQVTPLQQLTAVSAVANGGTLLEPHIVKSITDPQSGDTAKTQKKVVRQILSPDKAKEVGEYLEQVVSDRVIGTGRHAYIEGYRIAGKTGTAVKPVNGKYDYTKQVVSFIGYAPVDDPKIAMIVLIDEAKDSELGGGKAAAPIFKKIINKTLQYMGVPKKYSDSEQNGANSTVSGTKVPDLKNLTIENAKSTLSNLEISYATLGKGSKVVSQFPKAGSILKTGQHIYLLTEDGKNVSIPSLKGESLRDAMELLSVLGVPVTAKGEGYVVSQSVTGENGERRVILTLEPLMPADNQVEDTTEAGAQDEEVNQGEASGSSP